LAPRNRNGRNNSNRECRTKRGTTTFGPCGALGGCALTLGSRKKMINRPEVTIAVGCVTAFWIWFFCATVWGDLARKIYKARMHPIWRWFLMPTKLERTEENWIRGQKIFVWVSLPFFAFVMTMIIIDITTGR
jgi:hypothetical protein